MPAISRRDVKTYTISPECALTHNLRKNIFIEFLVEPPLLIAFRHIPTEATYPIFGQIPDIKAYVFE